MFFAKPQRREHRDSVVIHIILNQAAESIDSDDFLAEVMRRLSSVCGVVNQEYFLEDRAHFPKDESIDWNLALKVPGGTHEQSHSSYMPRAAPELDMGITARGSPGR